MTPTDDSATNAGIEAVIERGFAPRKVAGLGNSYGRFSSRFAITRWHDLVTAAIPMCGRYRMDIDCNETDQPHQKAYPEEMVGGPPEEVPEKHANAGTGNFISNFRGHLMIVLGLADSNTGPENTHVAVRELTAAGIPHEMALFWDEGHGIFRRTDVEIHPMRSAQFLVRAFFRGTAMNLKDFFVASPHDDGDAVTGHYYEVASPDASWAQVWGYTDRLSYAPGEVLVLHAMSSAPEARLEIFRDGLVAEKLAEARIALTFEATPEDCSVKGCDWPERYRLTIPMGWRSGVHVVRLTVAGHQSEHMFVLKAAKPEGILMVLATGTWAAYNDWGGSNHYQGITGPHRAEFAPQVSIHRPWAKGFVRWPDDAPRIPYASPLLSKPRYPHMDFARAKGISKKYASSGWAAFERPFALWCEAQGIALSYATQHDLHENRALLDSHARALIVGHDEYWTWEMRDNLEAWIDKGGELARFAGNFFWQTRLSPDLSVQTCYKYAAPQSDPTPDPSRLTSYWDHPQVGRPAVATMGITGSMGVYAGWSRCAAHGSGGFAIYRPEHWSVRDSGLGYGDVLGAAAKIFGYEVDGIEYTMTQGLPFAAEGVGLEGDLTIVGLSPATTLAHSTGLQDEDNFIGRLDAEEVALVVYGEVTPETLGRASRGNGCMVEYRRGRGAVYNAGSCEWVAGLIAGDPVVERVTRRILRGAWA